MNLETTHQVGPFTAARLRGRVDAQGHLLTGQVHQERTPGEQLSVEDFLDQKPDLVTAFHPDFRESRGTADMVRRARKAGVMVEVVQ